MAELKPTFCRVCEPACGLMAEVDDGALVAIRPDHDHPVSAGYACHKGIATFDMHHDPDRLDHPMIRRGGSLVRTTWDDAAEDIAARLGALVAEHGNSALAAYVGNPLGFNALGNMGLGVLLGQLPGFRFFSAGTQDCVNKFTGSTAVYGSRVVHPMPDIDHTDFMLVVGGNPRVSQGSFLSIPNMIQRIREATQRGAHVHFVNPRRIERAEDGTGDTLLIKPDTDVYFLAALLHAIDARGGFDQATIDRHGRNIAGLRAFIADYPADRVAAVTGIDAETVDELAAEIIAAPAASFYMSTGVNMGRQGTLAYWLIQMLSFATGNLDQPGGNISSIGYYPNAGGGASVFEAGWVDTEFGTFRSGNLPGNLLADYILDVDEPVRALIVAGGNPLLSVAGEARLREAFDQLELLIVVDIYPSATAEYATHLLAATDMYERADISVVMLGLQAIPHVQYTERLVEPAAERREEWWIFSTIARAMGYRTPLDGKGAEDLWGKYDHMLGASGLSLEDLRAAPRGIVTGGLDPGRFFDEVIQTADGLVDCCPDGFADAIERSAALFADLEGEGAGQLKLIGRRDAWMHNSFFHNLDRMHRGGRDTNVIYMNPVDASARSLSEGDPVAVTSEWGSIELAVALDEELRPNVVAITHGWGHQGAAGLSVAAATAGVNVNAILPVGPGSFEPLSSQSHMTGVPVDVTAVS